MPKRHPLDEIFEMIAEADDRIEAGDPLRLIVQKLGISSSTYHRWRREVNGLDASGARRAEELRRLVVRLRRDNLRKELDVDALRSLCEQIERDEMGGPGEGGMA